MQRRRCFTQPKGQCSTPSPPAPADGYSQTYAKIIPGFRCVGRMARDRNSETDNVKSTFCLCFFFNLETGISQDLNVNVVQAVSFQGQKEDAFCIS